MNLEARGEGISPQLFLRVKDDEGRFPVNKRHRARSVTPVVQHDVTHRETSWGSSLYVRTIDIPSERTVSQTDRRTDRRTEDRRRCTHHNTHVLVLRGGGARKKVTSSLLQTLRHSILGASRALASLLVSRNETDAFATEM